MSFQAYLDNIKTKTGKTPDDFKNLAVKKGLLKQGVKAGEIVAWLKEDFSLGHGHSMAIYAVFKSKGWVDANKSTMKTVRTNESTTTKPSEPDKVDAFMKNIKHPLVKVVQALRQIILSTDKKIGEEIYWNAPAFFYTGKMKPFNPKEYKRFIVGFNLYKKDCIRLIFLRGAKVNDRSGLLEGTYADGRRLAMFYDLKDVQSKKKNLQKVIKMSLKLLDK